MGTLEIIVDQVTAMDLILGGKKLLGALFIMDKEQFEAVEKELDDANKGVFNFEGGLIAKTYFDK